MWAKVQRTGSAATCSFTAMLSMAREAEPRALPHTGHVALEPSAARHSRQNVWPHAATAALPSRNTPPCTGHSSAAGGFVTKKGPCHSARGVGRGVSV